MKTIITILFLMGVLIMAACQRADESSNTSWDWVLDHVPAIYAAQALTAEQIQSFVEFPPRQKPASFNLDSVLEKMRKATDGGLH